jgi:hypothetical protein
MPTQAMPYGRLDAMRHRWCMDGGLVEARGGVWAFCWEVGGGLDLVTGWLPERCGLRLDHQGVLRVCPEALKALKEYCGQRAC